MNKVYNLEKKYDLKPKELLFLKLLFDYKFDVIKAWLEVHPKSKAEGRSINTLASRFYKKIKQKINIQENYIDYLEICGVGFGRLTEEIQKGLAAMKTEYFKGIKVADCEDNTTRAKTRDLLADILGAKKKEVNVNTNLGTGVLLLPEEKLKDDWLNKSKELHSDQENGE